MNILNSEQMPEIERQMLSIDPFPAYDLPINTTLPTQLYSTSSIFMFSKGETPLQHALNKILSNTKKIVSLRSQDSNSTLKLFIYSLITLLFPSDSPAPNFSLLDTLKCTLFSRDLTFHLSLMNGQIIDDIQAKAMIARFLDCLTSSSISNTQRLQKGITMLDCSEMLMELLVLFLRIILGKLDVEGADDFTRQISFQDAIGNLLEFFDVKHRQLPSLFLIPDYNFFLAAADTLYFGEYLENQSSNITQDHLSEMPRECHQKQQESNKPSKGTRIYAKDVKILHSLLESGISNLLQSKETETPHFQEGQELNFGRIKKQERQEELKREFERLIMGCEGDSIPQETPKTEDENPSTPVIGGDCDFQSSEYFPTEAFGPSKLKNLLRQQTFNPDAYVESPKLNPEHQLNSNKNIVSVKDKSQTTFSPQTNNLSRFQTFANFANDMNFLGHEATLDNCPLKITETSLFVSRECLCFEVRRGRNKIVSKVIEFVVVPSRQFHSRSPRFVPNLKSSQNINANIPRTRVTPPKGQVKEQRIPAFLKTIKSNKSNKEKDKHSVSSKSKQSAKDHPHLHSQCPSPQSKMELDAQTINRINSKFAKCSAILTPKNPQETKSKDSKSTPRKNQSSSLSRRVTTELGGTIKRFDTRHCSARPTLGSGNNWKSSSNFHQPNGKKSGKQELMKRETMKVLPSSPPPIFLRASNALERDFRENHAGATGIRLMLAHSSEKYKECAQIATGGL